MFPKDITYPNCGVLLEKVYKIKKTGILHISDINVINVCVVGNTSKIQLL